MGWYCAGEALSTRSLRKKDLATPLKAPIGKIKQVANGCLCETVWGQRDVTKAVLENLKAVFALYHTQLSLFYLFFVSMDSWFHRSPWGVECCTNLEVIIT